MQCVDVVKAPTYKTISFFKASSTLSTSNVNETDPAVASHEMQTESNPPSSSYLLGNQVVRRVFVSVCENNHYGLVACVDKDGFLRVVGKSAFIHFLKVSGEGNCERPQSLVPLPILRLPVQGTDAGSPSLSNSVHLCWGPHQHGVTLCAVVPHAGIIILRYSWSGEQFNNPLKPTSPKASEWFEDKVSSVDCEGIDFETSPLTISCAPFYNVHNHSSPPQSEFSSGGGGYSPAIIGGRASTTIVGAVFSPYCNDLLVFFEGKPPSVTRRVGADTYSHPPHYFHHSSRMSASSATGGEKPASLSGGATGSASTTHKAGTIPCRSVLFRRGGGMTEGTPTNTWVCLKKSNKLLREVIRNHELNEEVGDAEGLLLPCTADGGDDGRSKDNKASSSSPSLSTLSRASRNKRRADRLASLLSSSSAQTGNHTQNSAGRSVNFPRYHSAAWHPPFTIRARQYIYDVEVNETTHYYSAATAGGPTQLSSSQQQEENASAAAASRAACDSGGGGNASDDANGDDALQDRRFRTSVSATSHTTVSRDMTMLALVARDGTIRIADVNIFMNSNTGWELCVIDVNAYLCSGRVAGGVGGNGGDIISVTWGPRLGEISSLAVLTTEFLIVFYMSFDQSSFIITTSSSTVSQQQQKKKSSSSASLPPIIRRRPQSYTWVSIEDVCVRPLRGTVWKSVVCGDEDGHCRLAPLERGETNNRRRDARKKKADGKAQDITKREEVISEEIFSVSLFNLQNRDDDSSPPRNLNNDDADDNGNHDESCDSRNDDENESDEDVDDDESHHNASIISVEGAPRNPNTATASMNTSGGKIKSQPHVVFGSSPISTAGSGGGLSGKAGGGGSSHNGGARVGGCSSSVRGGRGTSNGASPPTMIFSHNSILAETQQEVYSANAVVLQQPQSLQQFGTFVVGDVAVSPFALGKNTSLASLQWCVGGGAEGGRCVHYFIPTRDGYRCVEVPPSRCYLSNRGGASTQDEFIAYRHNAYTTTSASHDVSSKGIAYIEFLGKLSAWFPPPPSVLRLREWNEFILTHANPKLSANRSTHLGGESSLALAVTFVKNHHRCRHRKGAKEMVGDTLEIFLSPQQMKETYRSLAAIIDLTAASPATSSQQQTSAGGGGLMMASNTVGKQLLNDKMFNLIVRTCRRISHEPFQSSSHATTSSSHQRQTSAPPPTSTTPTIINTMGGSHSNDSDAGPFNGCTNILSSPSVASAEPTGILVDTQRIISLKRDGTIDIVTHETFQTARVGTTLHRGVAPFKIVV